MNHLRNCLLCHAPSADGTAACLGFIPKPGEAIPVEYYAHPKGDFVRADVTYLRQELFADGAGGRPGKWPTMQRFDYLVRRRPLNDKEVIDLADTGPPAPEATYPQRGGPIRAGTTDGPEHRPVPSAGLGP